MKTDYVLFPVIGLVVLLLGFQVYSMFDVSKKVIINTPVVTTPLTTAPQLKLPANIQSSAPIHFASFDEEVAYYKKNAKNPSNINIENAVKNMDVNLDGVCDKCGMAVLNCIQMGMENM